MILLDELKKFGLSQSEAKAYVTLMGLKEGRASDISKLSSLPRNKVYSIMESLHRKGFVEILPEKITCFRAVPFMSALKIFVEDNERRLEEIAKTGERIAGQLKNVSYEKKDVGEFTVYKSRKTIHKKLEGVLQQAKKSIFLCLEPSDMKRLYFVCRRLSGVRIDVITRIERDTKHMVKSWMEFANVRHAGNITSEKMAVVDSKDALVFEANSPLALNSTDPGFVSLISNFAGMLLASSVSAADRIAWLDTGKPIEEVKLIHGRENIFSRLRDMHRDTKKDAIMLTTANGLVRISKYFKDTIDSSRKRGVRMRCLTVIGRSNIEAAKNMGIEIRHADRVNAVFSCHDNSQMLLIQIKNDTIAPDSPEDLAVFTNQKSIVTTIRFILESLWEQAKPLEEKIQEIETGKPPEEIKFIREETPIYEITKKISSRAAAEICNISTEGSPARAVKFGTLDIDSDRAKRGVRLRYIFPVTKGNMSLVKKIMEFAEVRHVDSTPFRVRIVDDASCLLRQGEEEFAPEKFCIFSQAKYFVSSMKMFFEKMWANAAPAEERIRHLETADSF